MQMSGLYFNHMHPQLHQYFTSTLCHANAQHLSSNLFPLLVFGKLVEEEMGGWGLLLCYALCGILANVASIIFLPSSTLGLGASGAVFGLFTIAVWEKLKMEVAITAKGGIAGVNHVAHLGGAFAGFAIVLFLRLIIAAFERPSLRSSR
ncbi:hypothetical protein GUITHDRAFT_116754 [Guillardia theta CCMP2712]|uniref:Peptidase S54 rhomboid domain-containing protein n=1 Tax=Guillardia theta (strain CCMP2712) TaxID=905079 RepID=L1IL93_GUITC|nr:hypothetical protein GUITHDRAFT_116754 [Guillardia theta CCMP2712]EKX37028.1 hypothetical protein GUITHDRAFT_116754 [Guillardia theta CCMP2712]|eukprot:XP_005824008.1 hypothetical protein GUITHDRAFT_116754 [Guillardia theta CCMP2712]